MSERDELVEVVARALHDKSDTGYQWEAASEGSRRYWSDQARPVIAALDAHQDPTGEGREIQGEHLREWAELGIPTRCCFWCTLNDVNRALRAALGLDGGQRTCEHMAKTLPDGRCSECWGEQR